MNNIDGTISIAKELLTSGVGKRCDIRRLSNNYLFLYEKVKEFEKIIYKLKGGESIKRIISYRESRIYENSDNYNHASGSVCSEYKAVNKLLGFGLVTIGQHGWEHYEIKGPERHVNSFLFLTKTMSKLIQDAYNDGFEDGKKTMVLLASGKITLNELNNKVVEPKRR